MNLSPTDDGGRPHGFHSRASLAQAWAWLDGLSATEAPPELVTLDEAGGRILADALIARTDSPDANRAAVNGYAVRAADCDGASPYNPLSIGRASLLATGAELPAGTDAVLSPDQTQRSGALVDALAAIAPGAGVLARASQARAGDVLLRRGRCIGPRELAVLASLGVERIAVSRRPTIRLVIRGAKFGPDALGPMLKSLIARDGGALAGPNEGRANFVLIAGRAGDGLDDDSARVFEGDGGKIALRGVAIQPGGQTSFGVSGDGAPAILLPGEPFACLVAYDLLAARTVRRLVGRSATLPYRLATVALDRKIASPLGVVDIVPLRIAAGRARAVPIEAGLVDAEGFVIVAASSEGFPSGATIHVHRYDPDGGADREDGGRL